MKRDGVDCWVDGLISKTTCDAEIWGNLTLENGTLLFSLSFYLKLIFIGAILPATLVFKVTGCNTFGQDKQTHVDLEIL